MPSHQSFVESNRAALQYTGLSFSEADSIASDLSTAKTRADLERWASDREGDLKAQGMSFAEAADRVARELNAVGMWGLYAGDGHAPVAASERPASPRTAAQVSRDSDRAVEAAKALQRENPSLSFAEALDEALRRQPELYA
ncbi:MAG: hypothetical protein IT299_02420 [Dehalococcoidia bacterium]|nr:hypothetical protein [Dehalococcoidia bacterium]